MSQTKKIGGALLALTLAGCGIGPQVVSYSPDVASAAGARRAGLNKVGVEASKFGAQAAFVPGEIIVKFRNTGNFGATLTRFGLSRKNVIPRIGAMVTTTNADVLATVKKLQADPSVMYAEPNYIARISDDPTPPNDPDFGKQYAPQITQAAQGWAITQGNPDTLLAIVDTGIDASHPDLAAKVVTGYDAIDKDNDPRDGHGHGTHCAGIAAALTNNGVGMAGIAPANKIFAVRVLDDNGSGSYDDVAEGMIKAADMGAKVISMSLGGPTSAASIEDAVKYCMSKDALIVAATGNDGREKKSFPGAIPGVMAIGSTDNLDKRSSFSNYGAWVSVTAPGSRIWSTLPTYGSAMGKDYGYASGTSMATPAAAGLAILVRSQFPSFNSAQTRAKIEQAADDKGAAGFDKEFGHGRINVFKALSPAGARR